MKENPYTLMFGREPHESISRVVQKSEVLQSFRTGMPPQQIYMITGVRGCGKTVFMTEVENELRSDEEWIIIDLDSSSDMLKDLVDSLRNQKTLTSIFKKANINLSAFGVGVEVSNRDSITNVRIALTEMLESIKKHKKKVLITIDEVTATKNMRRFASVFQILVRQELPVYLLMAGLYENINNIQKEDIITFLFRAPKIELKSLNLGVIADNYKENFGISDEQAMTMAKYTKGYGYAFQLLGYCVWNAGGDFNKALKKYKSCLEDYVYEIIWSGLSHNDRKLAFGIATSKTGKASDIRDITGMSNNTYSTYRRRFIKNGFADGNEYGHLKFTLPFFGEYAIRMYDQE